MHGRLEAVRSVLSGRKATKKATQKKLSSVTSVLRTTGTGTVSTVSSTVYTVVRFPKTTDAPNPSRDTRSM